MEDVENVDSLLYLGSILDKLGGTEADIKRWLTLGRTAFTRLQKFCRSGRF